MRGIFYGIYLSGSAGGGRLVEDNRLDNNLYTGTEVRGDNNRVHRSAVYDTGGYPQTGIYATASVIANTVAGVFGTIADSSPTGIIVSGSGSEVRRNQVRGLVAAGSGYAYGIYAGAAGTTLADNRIPATATMGYGIFGIAADTFCAGNTVVNFATAYCSCEASTGNLSLP